MTGKNYQRYTARNSININFIVAIRVARARVVMSQAVYSDDILMTLLVSFTNTTNSWVSVPVDTVPPLKIEQHRGKSFRHRHGFGTARLFVPVLFNLIDVPVIVFTRSGTMFVSIAVVIAFKHERGISRGSLRRVPCLFKSR